MSFRAIAARSGLAVNVVTDSAADAEAILEPHEHF